VVQIVREALTCRDGEKISQALAPFSVLPRGLAGPSLLAMIVFEKYGQHEPAQSAIRALRARGPRSQPVDAGRSVGGCAAVLRPLAELIGLHVFAGDQRPRARRRDAGAGIGQAPDAHMSLNSRTHSLFALKNSLLLYRITGQHTRTKPLSKR
jgi:hypothetical protein